MTAWLRSSLRDVSPILRRAVRIQPEQSCPELGVRSFGKGTVHKPPLTGADAGTKRLFKIEPADLVLSNVFAWEGAIAAASPNDAGRYGSHRFITCVVDSSRACAEYLKYCLTATEDGKVQIRRASPGDFIYPKHEMPVPSMAKQLELRAIYQHMQALQAKHPAIRVANAALLPATLEQLFAEPATLPS
jgi:type I restriction enzyme S subunit